MIKVSIRASAVDFIKCISEFIKAKGEDEAYKCKGALQGVKGFCLAEDNAALDESRKGQQAVELQYRR